MNWLRDVIRGHRRMALLLLFLALAFKAVVPVGFMLAPAPDRLITVSICSAAVGTAKQMQIAIPGRQDSNDPTDAAKSQPCAFSGLFHPAIGADGILLAIAFAFIMALGLAPLRQLPPRPVSRLRPPLRGPPSLSV